MSAPDCIAEYLRRYGGALGERVLNQFPPLHNPGDPVSPWLHQLKRRPFPAQVLAILGTVKRLQEARCAAAIAECGTGKTLISLGSIFTAAQGRRFTALALVPPHLVTKWTKESHRPCRASECSSWTAFETELGRTDSPASTRFGCGMAGSCARV